MIVMKKVLFAHDHTFQYKNQSYYSYGSYPEIYWNRYLKFADHVEVLARKELNEDPEAGGYIFSFMKSGNGSVDITPVPPPSIANRLGMASGDFFKTIKDAVDGSDYIVARLPSEIGFLAALYANKTAKPVAIELVGCAYDAYKYRGGLQGALYAPISKWKTKRVCKSADAILYVSKKLKEDYPSDSHSYVIASNVVIDKVDCISDIKRRIGNRLGGRIVFGLIGSYFVDYKGVDVAIKSIALLRKSRIDVVLRVLGEGDKGKYLKIALDNGVGDAVYFDGLLPAGEPVKEWLRKCDYYMQPSRTEGMPRGLLEAMAVGLPAVGSRAGGIPDVLDKEKLHDVGDSEGLAMKISNLLEGDYECQVLKALEVSSFYLHEKIDERRADFFKKFFGEACETN